jgi:16S rRNA (guanine527-N7)-methyltransferase
VTARAVASLGELVELAFPLLEVGGRLIAWKRGEIVAELTAAGRALDALGGGSIEAHSLAVPGLVAHRLVVVRKTRPTPRGYPRDPAARRRSPW